MKKILVFLITMISAILLTGCQDIKDIVNEVKNLVIEESVNKLAEEVGIENFELPEHKDLSIEFDYNEESDVSKLGLEITEPTCELSEYKDQLVGYVEDALQEHVDLEDIVDFEPETIEGGYKWQYTYEKELEDGTYEEVSVSIVLKEVEGDFVLNLELENLGDIFASIKESIEKETQE